MVSRGRRSPANIMVSDGPNGVIVDRPPPPHELDDLEAEEWKAIVNSMPPSHFARSHQPMLAQLCRHVIAARRVAQMISVEVKKKKFDPGLYGKLLDLQVKETGAIVRLERSMRLTQLSIQNASAAKQLRPVRQIDNAPWKNSNKVIDEEAAA